jgi:threonine dehydratase
MEQCPFLIVLNPTTMLDVMTWRPSVETINETYDRIKDVVLHTPLMRNLNASNEHKANIYLKREDLQVVRSYKLRGAYNKISTLEASQLLNGVVCASAGNHAQGVAFSCKSLAIKGRIYMPITTPKQKINQVKMFGGEFVEVVLKGDTFDDAYTEALEDSQSTGTYFIHPFNDEKVIEGQGTVAKEIMDDANFDIDYLLVPIGGGGLAAGVSTYVKHLSPNTKIIGVEPEGAASMKASLENGENRTLASISKFVDGAAVKRAGDITFEICKTTLDKVITVPENKICSTILKLYNQDAIVVEPAGALTLSALDFLEDEIKDKNVVCVVSGSNNDITRMEEIKERSMLYEGLLHYFVVSFPQRAGALREFLTDVLSPSDDIVHFEYSKKNSRSSGPAVVGIELKSSDDFEGLVHRMKEGGFFTEYLNDNPELFQYMV